MAEPLWALRPSEKTAQLRTLIVCVSTNNKIDSRPKTPRERVLRSVGWHVVCGAPAPEDELAYQPVKYFGLTDAVARNFVVSDMLLNQLIAFVTREILSSGYVLPEYMKEAAWP